MTDEPLTHDEIRAVAVATMRGLAGVAIEIAEKMADMMERDNVAMAGPKALRVFAEALRTAAAEAAEKAN